LGQLPVEKKKRIVYRSKKSHASASRKDILAVSAEGGRGGKMGGHWEGH